MARKFIAAKISGWNTQLNIADRPVFIQTGGSIFSDILFFFKYAKTTDFDLLITVILDIKAKYPMFSQPKCRNIYLLFNYKKILNF